MKIKVDPQEYYPIFFITDKEGLEIEVDEKKLTEWQDTATKFFEAQEEIEKLYKIEEAKRIPTNTR